VHEAEAHAAEDKEKRELIDARNQADALAFSVEKSLNENRTKVAVGDISRIEAAINEVRDAVKTDDRARITKATDDLQKASHAMAETLYKAQEAGGGEEGKAGQEPKAAQDGDVVDAEFAETK
jgi:molecular chaperone DnaK